MARFLADEDIYADLTARLRDSGHDVLSVTDLPSRGDGDHLWLIRAAEDERIVLTHNWRDYLLLHNAWRAWASRWNLDPVPPHSGILCVPQKDLLDAGRTLFRISELLLDQSNLGNRYYRLLPAHGWVEFD